MVQIASNTKTDEFVVYYTCILGFLQVSFSFTHVLLSSLMGRLYKWDLDTESDFTYLQVSL